MAAFKRINAIEIHRTLIKREWIKRELVLTYRYECRLPQIKEPLLKTDSLEEAIKFCESKKISPSAKSLFPLFPNF